MKVFLAGQASHINLDWSNCKYNLESFYYFKSEQKKFLKRWDMFLLDSGAFTFMSNMSKAVNWVEYIKKYADFIVENDIKYFFELDIDTIVGYEKVKEYRKMLENMTNKKCIPVWHRGRGIDDFINTVKEYPYIAIGGVAIKEIRPDEYIFFEKLIKIAHENNCKVHGLGCTSMKVLKKYKFDSVDSTTWLRGRFGDVYIFDKDTMRIYKPKNSRLKSGEKANELCLQEWCKFQKYAETKL